MGCAQGVVGDIHDDPLIGRSLAFKTDAKAAPHQAVAAIAANQVLGLQAFAATLGVFQCELHTAVALLEAFEFAAEQHLDVVKALQAFEQHAISQRLNKGVTAGPAKLIGLGLDVCKAATFGRHEAHRMPGRGVRQHVIGKADGLECAQAFVVQANGARVVDQAVELFHQGDVYTTLAQVIGDHQPDRTRSDNGDIGAQVQGGSSGCRTHGYLRTALFFGFLVGRSMEIAKLVNNENPC